jgi:hypothetical protein
MAIEKAPQNADILHWDFPNSRYESTSANISGKQVGHVGKRSLHTPLPLQPRTSFDAVRQVGTYS